MSPTAEKIAALHGEHPEWCALQIASEIGVGPNRVRVLARKFEISLPRPGHGQAARGEAKRWHKFHVLFAPELYGEVRARAYGQNLSVSEYLRRLVTAHFQQNNGG